MNGHLVSCCELNPSLPQIELLDLAPILMGHLGHSGVYTSVEVSLDCPERVRRTVKYAAKLWKCHRVLRRTTV